MIATNVDETNNKYTMLFCFFVVHLPHMESMKFNISMRTLLYMNLISTELE